LRLNKIYLSLMYETERKIVQEPTR
jgi:hypothetical protein